MLAIAITLFYLVSGLLVNWDEVYKILMDGMLIFNSLIMGKKESEKATSEFAPIYKIMLNAFSNYLVVYYALNIIFLSLILSWFTKKINLAFHHHVVVIGYSSAYSILTWVLVILSGLIHLWVLLGIVVLLSFFNTNKMLNGYGDLKNEIKRPMIKSFTIYFTIALVLGILIAMVILK